MDGYFIRYEMKSPAEGPQLTNLSWQAMQLLFYWATSLECLERCFEFGKEMSLNFKLHIKKIQFTLCQIDSKNSQIRRSWPCLEHTRNISGGKWECKDHRSGICMDSTPHALPKMSVHHKWSSCGLGIWRDWWCTWLVKLQISFLRSSRSQAKIILWVRDQVGSSLTAVAGARVTSLRGQSNSHYCRATAGGPGSLHRQWDLLQGRSSRKASHCPVPPELPITRQSSPLDRILITLPRKLLAKRNLLLRYPICTLLRKLLWRRRLEETFQHQA